MMPEEIVCHEHVIADGRKVRHHMADAALPHVALVQLPDGAERAAERAAASRFDEPRRAVREARVLAATGGEVVPGGQRHLVELERAIRR